MDWLEMNVNLACVLPHLAQFFLKPFCVWWSKKLSHETLSPASASREIFWSREILTSQSASSKVDLEHKPNLGFLRWQDMVAQVVQLSSSLMAQLLPLLGKVDTGWVLTLVQVAGDDWIEKWLLCHRPLPSSRGFYPLPLVPWKALPSFLREVP